MVTAAKEQQFDTRPRDLGRSCGSDAMGYYRLLIDTSVKTKFLTHLIKLCILCYE